MKRTLKFLWIDDDPSRVEDFRALIERGDRFSKASLDIHSVKNKDVVAEVPEILKHTKLSLVVIDHVFSNAGGSGFREGSTVAAALREKWPDVPIVGVTAAMRVASKRKHFDRLKEAEYIDLFDWDQFDRSIPELFAISRDFRKLNGAQLDKPNKCLELLDCTVDGELLLSVLPAEFKQKPDAGTSHTFARWVIHKLIDRPGFLYDKAWLATMLGLNARGFEKVKSKFRNCAYTGVFASPARMRWWPTLVRSKLYKILPDAVSNLPWIAGRTLPGITKSHFSQCHICAKEIPETMAFPDETSDTCHPVCVKHTIPHPKSTTMFGFDEIRIFKPS